MQQQQIGRSDLYVAPLALGGNVFGWTADEPTSFKILDAFIAAGFNFIDTADVYSRWVPGHTGGESEEILGRWIKQSGKRSRVIVATKAGMEMGPERKGLSKAYIFRAVEDSLRRLQTDYIDLYQSHQDDSGTPLEETLEAFAQLIQAGKVRAIGASNYSAERLSEALEVSGRNGWPGYQSLQPLYNLYDRSGYEAGLESVCRERGLAVFTYFSLASGFLTGKYRSESDLSRKARGQMVKKYLDERGTRILQALDRVADRYEANPTQVALAWLMGRPSVTAPIASATSLTQLNDLIAATRLRLDESAIQSLNQASD
jgi:aryl-alcohol dehydrogenase-like predicted oxidoreductase